MKPGSRLPFNFALAFALSALVTMAISGLWAQDAESESGTKPAAEKPRQEVFPEAVTREHFSAIRQQSPFLRNLNLAATYSLRGVAEIDGRPVATLYNRETKKTLTISKNEPNDAGIQMVEVIPGKNLGNVTVKVSVGGEVFELKYDADQLSPLARASSSGGNKGGGKGGDGERRGPSAEMRKQYESLSKEQQEKFHQYARQTSQKNPNISREERHNMIRGALARLAEGKNIEGDSK